MKEGDLIYQVPISGGRLRRTVERLQVPREASTHLEPPQGPPPGHKSSTPSMQSMQMADCGRPVDRRLDAPRKDRREPVRRSLRGRALRFCICRRIVIVPIPALHLSFLPAHLFPSLLSSPCPRVAGLQESRCWVSLQKRVSPLVFERFERGKEKTKGKKHKTSHLTCADPPQMTMRRLPRSTMKLLPRTKPTTTTLPTSRAMATRPSTTILTSYARRTPPRRSSWPRSTCV
jgi:hypothetical protein